MAESKSTNDRAANAASEPDPIVQRFHLFHRAVERAHLPGVAVADFAESVAHISTGLGVVMDILERNETLVQEAQDASHDEAKPAPILSRGDAWALNRLVRRSLDALTSDAEDLMDWAYKHHTLEGRREAAGMAVVPASGS